MFVPANVLSPWHIFIHSSPAGFWHEIGELGEILIKGQFPKGWVGSRQMPGSRGTQGRWGRCEDGAGPGLQGHSGVRKASLTRGVKEAAAQRSPGGKCCLSCSFSSSAWPWTNRPSRAQNTSVLTDKDLIQPGPGHHLVWEYLPWFQA